MTLPVVAGVLDAVLAGKNVFFTGNAGTGKSFLLRKILDALPKEGTVCTASTGIAACAVGGLTLHSFAGIKVSPPRAFVVSTRRPSHGRWMMMIPSRDKQAFPKSSSSGLQPKSSSSRRSAWSTGVISIW
jgi:hypothetical protein